MPGEYFVVTINSGARQVPREAVQLVLNGHQDWLRFSNDCYFVFSQSTSQQIYEQIKPVLNAEDFVVVSKVDVGTVYGWAAHVAVEWFNKPRF